MRNSRGYLSLFITVLIWGTTFMVTKLVLGVIGPLQLTILRMVLAFFALAPLAFREGFHLKDVLRRDFMLFGLTGTTLYSAFQNIGMTYTSVSNTVLILAMVPALTTMLAALFLKERIGKIQILGLILVTAGVILVSFENSADENYAHPGIGNLLIFLCGLSWAIYTIQGRKMSQNQSALVMTVASTGAAILQLLPLVAWETCRQGWPQLSLTAWMGILYLGLASSGLTALLWNVALHYLSASVASSYVNLSSVIGLASAVLMGEQLPLIQIIGGAMTLGGVLLSSRSPKLQVEAEISQP